ncbi:MAG: hypothetical protein FJW40_23290 [Acidobacteria bacterium]|nr:hypothetical protein [Acidobacteriota bacterium]
MRWMLLWVLLGVASAAAEAPDWVTALGGRVEQNGRGEVTGVVLRSSWVTDGDLDQLTKLPQLTRLDLALTRVSDLGLLRLKGLKGVTDLDLFYAEQITDEGMAAVRTWTGLKRVNVRGTKITDSTLAILGKLPGIERLDIGFAEVTDSGMMNLAGLQSLKELSYGGNKMTDVSLQVVLSLPGLTKLDLAGRQRTDSGLWTVALTDLGLDPILTLKQLRELNLAGTLVSARGVAKLTALTRLERLDLHGAKRVGDDVVPHLAAMPGLAWVDLRDTGVTAEGVAKLRSARHGLRVD